ncbi:MAG: Uma2 family endonuclease [Chloroflexota bacterium]|nr:Uma2 family endonuclease [Chloroflexota bacterium]
MTVADYLEWEERQELKHEYIDGEIIEMTGGTRIHSRLIVNLTLAMGRQLENSDYVIHSNHLRVRIDQTRYVYPDLSVVLGRELMEDERELTLLNPIFVVEVTSPSSDRRDRVDKRDYYFAVPSVEAYLIIDQDRVRAELYTRAEAGWLLRLFTSLDDVIALPALHCELLLAQVYLDISFE